MNTTTSPLTPETDALAVVCYGEGGIEASYGFRAVPIKDCRKLERERDEAREQLQAMREVIAAAEKCRHWHDCSYNEDTGKTEGVIISAESFWSLQNALSKLQPFIKP